MQKFSACRKRLSLIHFRFSTSSLCMMAICPVGPPKLMKPSLSQKRKASANVGGTAVPFPLGVVATGLSDSSGMLNKAQGFFVTTLVCPKCFLASYRLGVFVFG